ncbi:MAG: hypothetical protein JWO82_565, partial [Akkermansiaceae bacterium]|nr:hypothetical protein [Akkermansiaceae bacterium]
LDFIDRHTDSLGGSEKDGPSYALTDQNGAISKQLLNQLEIPPERLPQLQQKLDEIKSRASTLLAGRMTLDPRESRPEKGLLVYNIPPDADVAADLRRDLDAGFTPIVGSEKSATLVKSCSVLAGFGSEGLTLKVTTRPASGEKTLLYEQYSARTRQPSLSGTINTPEQITARFGPAFRHLLQP